MSKNPKGLTVSIEEDGGLNHVKPKEVEMKALPFITYDEKKGFVLNKEAEAVLLSRSEDRKVGVISIVGKYRTGKSFFTNRVLLNHHGKGGFSVGPTVNPCTKGLWIWNTPLKSDNPDFPDMDIFLIDTEGFGGTDENVNHDSRIFLFSLLLSSFFIYNSVGNIDENALNALSLIINLAKDIQIKTGKTTKDQDPAQFFPSFLWVVRDFTLKMVDLEGKPLAPKEYLEKALEFQKGVSDAIESKNRIRKLLKHFFQDRDCVTMVRPLEDENALQKLDETADDNLRPEFLVQIDQARNKIFKKIRPKMLNGNTFNGSMLVELINAYINAINSGQVPNIEHAFQYMMKNESKKAFQDSLMKVEKELSEYLKSPIAHDDVKMKDIKKKLEEGALKNFKKKALGDEEMLQDYMTELSQKVKENFKKVKEKNLSNWANVYQEFAGPTLEEIDKKLKNDGYSNFYEFQVEVNKFKEHFEKEAPNSGEKPKFLKELCEKLYATAAEFISKKSENVLGRETMRLKKKIEETEDDLEHKKKGWEKDKEELEKKLNVMERERAASRVNHQTWKEKFEQCKHEKEIIEANYNDLLTKSKDNEANLSKYGQENANKMEKKLESIKNEHSKIQLDLEKKIALADQEVSFGKKEIENQNSRIKALEKENHKLKEEIKSGNKGVDEMRKKLNEAELSKAQELMRAQMEFEKNLQELKKKRKEESDEDDEEVERKPKKNQQWPQQYPNWLEEKMKLENEVNFLKGKLEEGQKVQEAFKMAIEHGVNFNDNDNIQTLNNCELVETNKNLSTSLEKSDTRCKEYQEKVNHIKIYKKMINNCSSLQCLHCSQNILIGVFIPHLVSCAKIDLANYNKYPISNSMSNLSNSGKFTVSGPVKDLNSISYSTPLKQILTPNVSITPQEMPKKSDNKKQSEKGKQEVKETKKKNSNETPEDEEIEENEEKSQNNNNNANNSNNSPDFVINIAQTLIKEGNDHKPFIEYLIYCKKGLQKWLVSRKYKNFCEMHQILIGLFPGFQFPSTSKALINSFNDFNNLQDLRKPKIIDERKIMLESYLQEIAKNSEILNCLPFKQFVGIEGKNGKQFSNDFLDLDNPEEKPQSAFSARNFGGNYQDDSYNKSFQPNLSSFRIDRKMLPESPETFMRNWENQSGSKINKSPNSTIKKEPVMIHHIKGKSENELKATTPEKTHGEYNNDIMEKIKEGKEIYRNQYYGGDDYNDNNNNNNNGSMMFLYDCGHCLSGNVKANGPNPRKINSFCPGCIAGQSNKSSGTKWNGSGSKIKAMN